MGNELLLTGGTGAALLASDSGDFGFMIKLLKEFEIFGIKLNITSTHISLIIVTITLLILGCIVAIK